MDQPPIAVEKSAGSGLTIAFHSVKLTDDEFFWLCRDNPELRMELTAEGDLIVTPPTGSETGSRNAKLTQRIANWTEVDGTGLSFDSSTGFTLPNGAKRSPDGSWIRRGRWEAMTREQRAKFAPICPEFVAELRSGEDRLPTLLAKMEEYIENGVELGWLLDPTVRSVYIYRAGLPVECLDNPKSISADPVLRCFVLSLSDIW